MFLLDTPVIAELRKAKAGQADAQVTRWASSTASQNLFISVISLLELDAGVAQLERKDRAQGTAMRAWLDDVVPRAFDGRILSVDVAVTKKRAALPYAESRQADSRHERDALLAAIALTHGLTLVTRNLSAFRFGRVKLLNPWGYTPEQEDDGGDWQEVSRSGPMWLKNLFLRF